VTRVRSRAARGVLFVDSSAFFAIAIRADTNYSAAQSVLERVARDRVRFITTTYLVVEAHALFVAKAGREAGVRFLRGLEGGAVDVVRPTAEDEARAREIIYGYTDKSFSLADAISFAVMQRLGIGTAFSFDSDFRQFGFALA
jgi:uncharacterized protein